MPLTLLFSWGAYYFAKPGFHAVMEMTPATGRVVVPAGVEGEVEVEFQHNGAAVRFPLPGRARFDADELVPVRYNPSDPKDAILARFDDLWATSLIMSIFALALGGAGVFVWSPMSGPRPNR